MINLKQMLDNAYLLYNKKKYKEAQYHFEIVKQEIDRNQGYSKSLDFFIDRCKENYFNDEEIETYSLKNFNTVLLVNPSHHHPEERKFWKEFIDILSTKGIYAIDLNFRNVTPFSSNITIVNPARSFDLARKLKQFDILELPKWIDKTDINVYDDWEHRRWQIPKYDFNVSKGIEVVSKYIDSLILNIRPALIMSSNKIDWPNQCAFKASKYYNIPYYFIERSPFDSHLVEREGMFGESNRIELLIQQFLLSEQDKTDGKILLKKLVDNPYGFRVDEAVKEEINIDFKKEKIFFLPLDNILWTAWGLKGHKQSEIDYPIYSTPEEAIKDISYNVKRLGGTLIVKPHPSCKEWHRLKDRFPEVIFTNADLKLLIEKSSVIISFLTKVSYVALAHKKPVVSFKTGLLDGLGITYEIKHKNYLFNSLSESLAKKDFNKKYKTFIEILPKLNNSLCDNGSELFNFVKESLEVSESIAKGSIEDYTLQNNLLKNENLKKLHFIDKTEYCDEKHFLLFDVSRLLNYKLHNSGISRYVLELAKRIAKSNIFNFVPVALPQINEYGISANVVHQLEDVLNAKILKVEEGFAIAESSNMKYIYHSPILPNFIKKRSKNNIPVITIYDIFHLTMPELYNNENHITQKIVDAIDLDETNILCISNFTKKQLESYFKREVKSVKVTHLGISNEFLNFDNSIKSDKLDQIFQQIRNRQIVTFPFQADPRKGFDRMLAISEQWRNMDEKNRAIVIYGSSSNKKKFEKITYKYNEVYYLENASDSELANLYNRSICHLYFSDAEGFGLPPLEAMAIGCPSIMFNNTAHTEVYKDWNFLVESNIKNIQLVDILNKLAENEVYLSKQRINALKFSSKYTWNSTYLETLEFYIKLIKEN